jgi:hypothetical protein
MEGIKDAMKLLRCEKYVMPVLACIYTGMREAPIRGIPGALLITCHPNGASSRFMDLDSEEENSLFNYCMKAAVTVVCSDRYANLDEGERRLFKDYIVVGIETPCGCYNINLIKYDDPWMTWTDGEAKLQKYLSIIHADQEGQEK